MVVDETNETTTDSVRDTIGKSNDEEQNQHKETRDFNMENPSNTKGEKPRAPISKLHYIGRGYKRRRFTTEQIIPYDGLQEVYITAVT